MMRLPGIVRYILKTAAVGSTVGIALAGGLVLVDAAGLGSLIASSPDPMVPLALFGIGFATLFGSLHTGSAIMMLPKDAGDDMWRQIES
jgi:hypothetical protein